LADVLPAFAKKLSIHLNIQDLNSNLIQKLSELFKANSGENSVNFEVMEIEKVTKILEQNVPVALPIAAESEEGDLDEVTVDLESELNEPDMEVNMPISVEENRVVTRLAMPSRKLKVKISKELLEELDKVPVNYKLN
jgi:DNA polymerase-3 subunit alpha